MPVGRFPVTGPTGLLPSPLAHVKIYFEFNMCENVGRVGPTYAATCRIEHEHDIHTAAVCSRAPTTHICPVHWPPRRYVTQSPLPKLGFPSYATPWLTPKAKHFCPSTSFCSKKQGKKGRVSSFWLRYSPLTFSLNASEICFSSLSSAPLGGLFESLGSESFQLLFSKFSLLFSLPSFFRLGESLSRGIRV